MSHTDDRPCTATRRRGRPVGSNSVVTRNRVLAAARRVINQRGFPAATFQAIALEADISRPTLHYYFSSREEIYEALADEAAVVVAECIAGAKQAETLPDSMIALVGALREAAGHDESRIAFLVSARLEASRNPGLADRHGAELREHLTGLVAAAVQRGELPAGTAVAPIAEMLQAMLWGVGMCAGFLTDQTDLRRVTEQLEVLFAHGLFPGRPADPDS